MSKDEDPCKYWYISDGGDVYSLSDYFVGSEIEEAHREIDNLFETKEEAEKAVEKLKAWKQLKDDGIIFILDEFNGTPLIKIQSKEEKGPVDKVIRIIKNLTLLFGGEDE